MAAAVVAEEGNVEAVGVGRGRGGNEGVAVVDVVVVRAGGDGAATGCFRRCAVRKGRS